jgi:hypothetical protein
LTFYEQAGEANLKIGNTAGQPLARTNIAEILVDLGEWEKAEALLVEPCPSGGRRGIGTFWPFACRISDGAAAQGADR